ncbi:MAG TPA: hypothetical protein PKA63_06635 [Oligoflexia bacterium]|nr:hypothetical protein [Oligoflexia bacterium]HMP48326.1 hypothetical protein [Oligoflexia bacterium]
MKILKSAQTILSIQIIIVFIICFSLFLSLLTPTKLLADKRKAGSISSWVDKDGVRHFSSSEPAPSVESYPKEKINLPEIEKYDIDTRIKELKAQTPETCLHRGGINCEAGVDTDGSVICHDGFRNSLEQFDISCSEVRLISSIKAPPSKSKRLMKVPIIIEVRNESGIEAKEVRVKVSYPVAPYEEERIELSLEGPTSIPSYGIAEYSYSGKLIDDRIAPRGHVKITCENCWKPNLESKQTEQNEAGQKSTNQDNSDKQKNNPTPAKVSPIGRF